MKGGEGKHNIEKNFSFFPNLRLVTANIDGLGTDSDRRKKVIKYLEYNVFNDSL